MKIQLMVHAARTKIQPMVHVPSNYGARKSHLWRTRKNAQSHSWLMFSAISKTS